MVLDLTYDFDPSIPPPHFDEKVYRVDVRLAACHVSRG